MSTKQPAQPPVRHKALARSILRGFTLAMILFVICIAIKPAGLDANHGLSYYGVREATIIPYALALAVSAYTYWILAVSFDTHRLPASLLSLALRIMAVLCVGLLLTPHTLFDPIHVAFGTALFGLQFVVEGWFVWLTGADRWLAGLAALQLVCGLGAFYYLVHPNGLLLETQIAYQIAFGLSLYRITDKGILREDF